MFNPIFFYLIYALLFPDRDIIISKEKNPSNPKIEQVKSKFHSTDEVGYQVNLWNQRGVNELTINKVGILSYTIKADTNLKLIKAKPGGNSFENIVKDYKNVGFLMNAGMFHENYQPVGLLINKSQKFNSLDSSIAPGFGNFYMYPNGVFFLNKKLQPKVVITDFYKSFYSEDSTIYLATQSGPILVYNGQIHPGFGINSTNKNIRNGVGVNKKGEIVFAISKEPITFYDFAYAFREFLDCPNALYLDGTISQMLIKSTSDQIFVNHDVSRKFGPVFLLQK